VFLKEPGGAFDVREEKGDGAGREICHPTNYCVAPWPCQGARCASPLQSGVHKTRPA
jgi:hypothetical protein